MTCHSFAALADASNDVIPLDPKQIQNECLVLSESFLYQIRHLMDVLQVLGVAETPRLVHLLSQLDFNGFYISIAPKDQFMPNPLLPPVSV